VLISSIENNKIKEISKLNIKKYREESNKFIVEGFHLVEEAYKSNALEEILMLEDEHIDYSLPITYVTKEVMKKITSLETIPSIIGICKMIENTNIGERVLILDGIQDPGNLGTIIRSSVAFNIDTIVLSNDTVDLYNSKVLRATQGMLFQINILRRDLLNFISELKSKDYKIYSTNVVNGNDISNVKKHNKYAIIVGNEGNGIKKDIQDLSDENIYIKMNEKCESLNVGVATGIILYELNK
jgi:TrmH family RNA methyltransferase